MLKFIVSTVQNIKQIIKMSFVKLCELVNEVINFRNRRNCCFRCRIGQRSYKLNLQYSKCVEIITNVDNLSLMF